MTGREYDEALEEATNAAHKAWCEKGGLPLDDADLTELNDKMNEVFRRYGPGWE